MTYYVRRLLSCRSEGNEKKDNATIMLRTMTDQEERKGWKGKWPRKKGPWIWLCCVLKLPWWQDTCGRGMTDWLARRVRVNFVFHLLGYIASFIPSFRDTLSVLTCVSCFVRMFVLYMCIELECTFAILLIKTCPFRQKLNLLGVQGQARQTFGSLMWFFSAKTWAVVAIYVKLMAFLS